MTWWASRFGPSRESAANELISCSTTHLVTLDVSTGAILNEYPAGAEQDIEQRFMDAMLEGGRPYSESEKSSILERESFPIRGRLFGRAHLFGENLVFGTEEGWVYWFDPTSLRPLCRYRAGQRAKEVPVWAPETLVAAASDAVFGLDPASGDTLWRRDVGPVSQIVASDTLAIVGEDRIDVLDPRTGARRWSARGDYRAIATVDDHGWLAFARKGTLQLLDTAGTAVGAPIDTHRSIDAVTAMGARQWAVASRDGDVSTAAWQEPNVLDWPIWNAHLDVAVEALYSSGPTLIAASKDRLVGLSSIDGSDTWELPLNDDEIPMVNDYLFVSGDDVLRIYDPQGGTLLKELTVQSRIVGATLVDNTIVWLDASGAAHRAPLEGEGSEESVDLGDPLSRASFQDGMFLVTTDAGEIGLVELVAPAEVTLSQPQ
jgi:outer membrane protein assembly factor BamB